MLAQDLVVVLTEEAPHLVGGVGSLPWTLHWDYRRASGCCHYQGVL